MPSLKSRHTREILFAGLAPLASGLSAYSSSARPKVVQAAIIPQNGTLAVLAMIILVITGAALIFGPFLRMPSKTDRDSQIRPVEGVKSVGPPPQPQPTESEAILAAMREDASDIAKHPDAAKQEEDEGREYRKAA